MSESPLACNLGAFTPEERAEHTDLLVGLRRRAIELRETEDGYSFQFSADDLGKTARFVELERRCCPFLDFELSIGRDDGPLWLRLGGREGVKELLWLELGLSEARSSPALPIL